MIKAGISTEDAWGRSTHADSAVRLVPGCQRWANGRDRPKRGGGFRRIWILFLTSLLNWFSGVNRDRPKAYLGIGAFNLVRAAAYRQCGGYALLNSTWVTLRQGGVRWRDTFYALDTLRRGTVR